VRRERRAFENPDYDGWRIGIEPIVSPPCRCDRPHYLRDEVGTRCVLCGRRPPLRIDLEAMRIKQL
jgi:hypothetical protein